MFISSESVVGGDRNVDGSGHMSFLNFTVEDFIGIEEEDGGEVLIFHATIIVSLLFVRILIGSHDGLEYGRFVGDRAG